jgi:hypothetical protein
MGLLEQAIADAKNIVENAASGFGSEMILTAPNAATITIKGLHTKHHLGINTDGEIVNSKKASISFSEGSFSGSAYPLRNSAGQVALKNHLVAVKDSTGTLCSYVIREWFPDETMGLITCILGDHE